MKWKKFIQRFPNEAMYHRNYIYSNIASTNISKKHMKLPKNIGFLIQKYVATCLEIFCFQHTSITSLPKSLFIFPYLQRLHLYGNKIQRIPERFGNLKNLEWLVVDENKIKHIPYCIKKLKELRIFCYDHRITHTFPLSIQEIPWFTRTNIGFIKSSINWLDFVYFY